MKQQCCVVCKVYTTHGAGGVAAAVECGVGCLPGGSAVDARDPGAGGCEKAQDGGHHLHWRHFLVDRETKGERESNLCGMESAEGVLMVALGKGQGG